MDLEELRSVREQERRTDSLQHLRDSFYDDAATYVRQLKHERSRRAEQAGDPYAAAAMRLTDEIDTAEEVIESLYERRRGKVVKLASFAAAGMPAETDGMTEQERSMFDDVVERIENNEERVLGALDGSADAPETQVGDGATDAARTVPATDTAGTTSAGDAARATGEADTIGSPPEAEALGPVDETSAPGVGDETDPLDTTDETDPLDGTEPVGAAPTPSVGEEPVDAVDRGSATADGGVGGAAGGDGSVLADAMGGPAASGDESAGNAAPTDETQSTANPDPAGAESSGGTDRPVAEAAVATGVEEPPTGERETDGVSEPEAAPPTGGTAETTSTAAATASASSAADDSVSATADGVSTTVDGVSTTADTATENGPATDDGATTDDGSTADDRPTANDGPTADDNGGAADDTPAVERSTVRVTSDVGEVFGVDDRTYELAASDVVHLPQMVAEPLVDQGVAEQL